MISHLYILNFCFFALSALDCLNDEDCFDLGNSVGKFNPTMPNFKRSTRKCTTDEHCNEIYDTTRFICHNQQCQCALGTYREDEDTCESLMLAFLDKTVVSIVIVLFLGLIVILLKLFLRFCKKRRENKGLIRLKGIRLTNNATVSYEP